MSDYPKYFPHWAKDFSDFAETCSAFYIWMTMMDEKAPKDRCFQMARTEMCSYQDFNILLATFLDFAHQSGWQLQKTRGTPDKMDEHVGELLELEKAWFSLLNPDAISFRSITQEEAIRVIDEWKVWLPYMPAPVYAIYLKQKGEANAD